MGRVRLLLVVAKIHGLKSKSIDFVLAFHQADLDVPVYMELPQESTRLLFQMETDADTS